MTEIKNYTELRERLAFEADDDYREFVKMGIPSDRPFVGVRVPALRELVKLVSKEQYEELLNTDPVAFEEVLFRGFLIASLPYEKMLDYFDSQIELIDDWCSCDLFCSSIRKTINKHREDFFEQKIEGLLDSKSEFATRVGLVILKSSYMDFDYLGVIFDRAESLASREEYYIKMALAWLIAECFIIFPDETLSYLKISKLSKWTFNKSISKICDSRRVESDMKDYLKTLRRK